MLKATPLPLRSWHFLRRPLHAYLLRVEVGSRDWPSLAGRRLFCYLGSKVQAERNPSPSDSAVSLILRRQCTLGEATSFPTSAPRETGIPRRLKRTDPAPRFCSTPPTQSACAVTTGLLHSSLDSESIDLPAWNRWRARISESARGAVRCGERARGSAARPLGALALLVGESKRLGWKAGESSPEQEPTGRVCDVRSRAGKRALSVWTSDQLQLGGSWGGRYEASHTIHPE
ncbi:hypothetical protein C8J57DRAFT_1498202 [Mycena rebaudengoi]|nr:hypothetical protein C8J57DRAFT_1498202 [Mycena rebaudengoi]